MDSEILAELTSITALLGDVHAYCEQCVWLLVGVAGGVGWVSGVVFAGLFIWVRNLRSPA